MQRSGLDLMAEDVATLLDTLRVTPVAVIGHSAGGALALRLADGRLPTVKAVIGLNPALDDFGGAAGWLFPMMAKALALNPFVAPTLSRLTTPRAVDRLIEATGSQIDPLGRACYRACLASTAHLDGTLTMMSQWQLGRLRRDFARVTVPVLLLTGAKDTAVPPESSRAAVAALPNARHLNLGDYGHLAHEEAPHKTAEAIFTALDYAECFALV